MGLTLSDFLFKAHTFFLEKVCGVSVLLSGGVNKAG